MRVEDFDTWLRSHGCGEYAERLLANSIDSTEVLLHLSDADFRNLDIPLGVRVRLRRLAESDQRDKSPENAVTERRQLTILFSDVVGSTALSTRMDPEDLADLLRRYHDRCLDIVSRYDGTVAQLLGDGMLAYFGYPQAHEDDAIRAVMAGLEIVSPAAADGEDLPSEVEVRVGIATGLTVVGAPLLSRHSKGAGIIGETPNLAARVQSEARPGWVVVASGTARLLGATFEAEDIGARPLKGIPEPVQLYRVLGVRETESRFAAFHNIGEAPLLGRETQLKELLDCWDRTQSSLATALLVTAEAGMGKSRLAYELLKRTSVDGHLVLQCSSFHRTSPFFPVLEHIWRRVAANPHPRPEKLRAALDQELSNVGLYDTVSSQVLAELMGLPAVAQDAEQMSGAQRRARSLALLTSYLLNRASRPAVVLFEDAHWADPSTIELIGRLLDTPSFGLLIAITARSGFDPPWPVETQIALPPLDPAASWALVEFVSAPSQLNLDIEAIMSRSSGVPLFLEELTLSMVQQVGDETETFTVPPTLKDGLTARLDRLGRAKHVAQVAASFGREFNRDLLATVVDVDDEELDRQLSILSEANIVDPGAAGTYSFHHALIRDAAYETMLRSTRRSVHARIADTLTADGTPAGLVPEAVVARHLELGGRGAQAADAWLKAAQQASRRSAVAEAIADSDAGLHVLATLEDAEANEPLELQLLLLKAGMLRVSRGFGSQEARIAYEAAGALCRKLGDDGRLVIALTGLYSYYHQHDYHSARSVALELLDVVERRLIPAEQMIAHRAMGVVLFHMGHPAEAADHLERSLGLYDADRDGPDAFVYGTDHAETAASFLAMAKWGSGDQAAAVEFIDWSVAHAKALQHAPSVAQALVYRCFLTALITDRTLTDTASELASLCSGGNFELFGIAARFFGAMGRWWLQGEVEEVATLLDETEAAWLACGSDGYRPYRNAVLASVAGARGDVVKGLRLAEEGLGLASASGEHWTDAELHRTRGDLHLQARARPEAEAAYREAVDVARLQGNASLELKALTSLLAVAPGAAADLAAALGRVHGEGSDIDRARSALASLR